MQKLCTSYKNCSESPSVLFTKKSHPIFGCGKCGHRFIQVSDRENHVSKVYSDDYFFSGKEGYPNYLNEKELLYEQGLRYSKLISKYKKTGKVLDVGSAAGFILKGFEQSGWDCYGIEPNKTMAAFGRDELNLKIETGNIETFASTGKFDLINMIQVIGHVYDPDLALQNVARLLKPNGLVLVESWNMNSAVARILGKRWHEYSPPSVSHWFSDKTLALLFKYYGFKLVAKGYPVKKISMEHALSFLEAKTSSFIFGKLRHSINGFAKKITIIYPLYDVKWYIFRKDSP
jgi:2-polyprenyl-3-methyl-5-hydroxy-6-metoxy-1,4-benzoquinol methylase